MKEYAVIYEEGPTSWGATVPDLPIILVVADTFEECQQLVKEAIAFHIKGLKKDGDPVPEPVTKVGMVPIAA